MRGMKTTKTAAKPKTAKGKQKAGKGVRTGGDAVPTRERILAAAKTVFAQYPYYTASIRMIGKAAGMDHPLISYYFPTKADLFEAVLEKIAGLYYAANAEWFSGLDKFGPDEGLSQYIDRMFAFAARHPEAIRAVAINLVQPEDTDIIPGYRKIQNLFARNAETFQETVGLKASFDQIRMFTESFNTLVINYLGAKTYYAGILGMKPQSPEYLQWVKETLMYLFLPRLEQLILG